MSFAFRPCKIPPISVSSDGDGDGMDVERGLWIYEAEMLDGTILSPVARG